MPEAQFYSATELATILGVNPITIREHAAKGILPAIRVGRLWRFPKAQIDPWLERRPPAPPEKKAEPEMDAETRAWLEADLEGDLPPYEWGEVDPLSVGQSVRYVSGVGLVIDDEEGPR
jgi:excisionase family DNA binding protein